jgi:hypothetical protein
MKLAFDRTRLPYDRTKMAWVRTATSLITFGFSVYKFLQIELGTTDPIDLIFRDPQRHPGRRACWARPGVSSARRCARADWRPRTQDTVEQ